MVRNHQVSMCVSFVLCGVFLIPAMTFASERVAGDIEVNLWGVSEHYERPEKVSRMKAWNEIHPGIGVRRYFQSPVEIGGLETFASIDYVARNSTGGKTFAAGIGGQYSLVSLGEAEVLVGATVGFLSYENVVSEYVDHEQKRYEWSTTWNGISGYPFAALRYRDLTGTVGYIPKIVSNNIQHTVPATFLFLNIRLQ